MFLRHLAFVTSPSSHFALSLLTRCLFVTCRLAFNMCHVAFVSRCIVTLPFITRRPLCVTSTSGATPQPVRSSFSFFSFLLLISLHVHVPLSRLCDTLPSSHVASHLLRHVSRDLACHHSVLPLVCPSTRRLNVALMGHAFPLASLWGTLVFLSFFFVIC